MGLYSVFIVTYVLVREKIEPALSLHKISQFVSERTSLLLYSAL